MAENHQPGSARISSCSTRPLSPGPGPGACRSGKVVVKVVPEVCMFLSSRVSIQPVNQPAHGSCPTGAVRGEPSQRPTYSAVATVFGAQLQRMQYNGRSQGTSAQKALSLPCMAGVLSRAQACYNHASLKRIMGWPGRLSSRLSSPREPLVLANSKLPAYPQYRVTAVSLHFSTHLTEVLQKQVGHEPGVRDRVGTGLRY